MTKADIITDINKVIVPNGNIIANDTNRILKNILDCDELNSKNSLDSFDFRGEINDNKGAILFYSIRGIKGLFANITVNINAGENTTNENSTVEMAFPHKDENLFQSLATVMSKSGDKDIIDFLVKIRNKNSTKIFKELGADIKKYRIACLNFRFNEKNLYFRIESQEINDNLITGDSIYTSFTIHNVIS